MNKTTLTALVIAGSMLATPLCASNFFHQLIQGKPASQSATNLPEKLIIKDNNQNYTDFSGTWTGNCSFDANYETPITIKVKNDDKHFAINDDELNIGPLHTKTASDDLNTTMEHTTLEWSKDMSVLVTKYVYLDKTHSVSPSNQSMPMTTVIGQFAFSLDNEQLVVKGQSISIRDLDKKSGLSNTTCTLSKK